MAALSESSSSFATTASNGTVVATSFARIGLMGNPSDGFGGKTVSLLLENFKATVTLTPMPPGEPLAFVAHPVRSF
jgi:glucuronokinase